MKRAQARSTVKSLVKSDAQTAFVAGLSVLKAGHADILLPAAQRLATKHPGDVRFQQMLGLAARSLGESDLAYRSFTRASQLAPNDPLIAHSNARTALEAGKPALELFEAAGRLAPSNGDVIRGIAAARLHERSPQDALQFLEQVLAANPLWTDGHRDAAHLRGQLGLDPLATIEGAIASHPAVEELHLLAINTALETLDPQAAQRLGENAGKRGFANPAFRIFSAHIASELGELETAGEIFARCDTTSRIADASYHARYLLRAGRPEDTARFLEPLISRDREHHLWPYLSLAWRLTGDERWSWLEGDEELVGVYDLSSDFAKIPGLADHLRAMHFAKSQPLGQSVRGGTQTDGHLLLRLDEPIIQLRKLLQRTVRKHIANLPDHREGHPTLLKDRSPALFSGSWSVRLTDGGFHSDHVHSKGWFSSALYVSLPDSLGDGTGEDHPGWLSLGECRDVVPDLAPVRLIEPRTARLVLFPSTMWHGTRRFPSGERLTVAFDIARPLQDNELT
ncbi:2OG-Fe(II) oxygenase family protein [Qipengyuania sphaerica]|uniref:2OG-Fe(II) oxygenase family protein n=1 Tax=Qipengyuania sphaerica TaxID=2867243 RepID=UPI001C883071|nr:putative 2OG-Fe(II) oxygenase [Qipengyuania sphaerica]MBX7539958.1 hypothetical protein [Qipengyuania sphaerica]